MASRHSTRQPTPLPKPNKPSKIKGDVIIISDDEEPSAVRRSSKPPKRKAAPIPVGDILEISDDEDQLKRRRTLRKADENVSSGAGSSVQAASLEQIKALESRLSDARRIEAENRAEIARLKVEIGDKKFLDPALLEDEVNCQLCYNQNWTPYLLPDCGHVSCQTCLTNWFSTTLQKHISNYPHYLPMTLDQLSPRVQAFYTRLRQNPDSLHVRLQLDLELTQYHYMRLQQQQMGMPPDPIYTCPSCRTVVKTRPVEVYPLKAVVRIVAEAMGESSPRRAASAPTAGRGSGINRGLWDPFFGIELSM